MHARNPFTHTQIEFSGQQTQPSHQAFLCPRPTPQRRMALLKSFFIPQMSMWSRAGSGSTLIKRQNRFTCRKIRKGLETHNCMHTWGLTIPESIHLNACVYLYLYICIYAHASIYPYPHIYIYKGCISVHIYVHIMYSIYIHIYTHACVLASNT